ncbi:MAG: hypothetical protein F6J93_26420 [Oscillatoria sp. SIO1A7]|nr:hypothetical protein [Oscillatoria sp. SIO1A7]
MGHRYKSLAGLHSTARALPRLAIAVNPDKRLAAEVQGMRCAIAAATITGLTQTVHI